MNKSIPIVDLTPYRLNTDKAGVAEKVRMACESIGFLVISGHGVDANVITSMLNACERFFALPVATKKAVRSLDRRASRGYAEFADMSLGQSLGVEAAPDLREGYASCRVDKADPYYANPEFGSIFADNVWPNEALVPGFEVAFTAYYREMDRLSTQLMRIFALALALPEYFFDDKVDRHCSSMNAYHYPAMGEPPKPGQLRGGAHTDFGSLTLVYGHPSIKGLQVSTGEDWQDVPEVTDAYVVNLGDLMQQWTNDRWHSTMHRVANPIEADWDKSRFSLVFFHQPNFDLLVESLDRNAPPKYSPITSGEHLMRKLAAMKLVASQSPGK